MYFLPVKLIEFATTAFMVFLVKVTVLYKYFTTLKNVAREVFQFFIL